MNTEYHIPVLLSEAIEGLYINPEGVYIDVTFGGGGHSRKILEKLTTGKLFAFDQDVDAAHNVIDDERLIFVQHNFSYLKNFLDYYGVSEVDGILADLGVSSHDFDEASRGFSFRFDADLDMRMNQSSELTAAKIINEYPGQQLTQLFVKYGELSNARKVVAAILAEREINPIKTTERLRSILEPLVPAKVSAKHMAKVFQALRIEVNSEIEVLKQLLNDAYSVLKPGGRLVVISYHSLEDRLVKNFIQKGNLEGKVEQDFYGNVKLIFKATGKVTVPNAAEIEKNPRARSAKMRIAEKI